MHNQSYSKKLLLNRLLLVLTTSTSIPTVYAEILIPDGKGHAINGEHLSDNIIVSGSSTEAMITNSTINGSLSVSRGAKTKIHDDVIICSSVNCKGIDVQGIGHDPNLSGDTSNLNGSHINITSSGEGLSSSGSTLVELTDVSINSAGYGLNLNGSVSKNNILNTTNIDKFNITAGGYGVFAIVGAQLNLSNGIVSTYADNANGVHLGGANYQGSTPVQTTAYLKNVTVHTTGNSSHGLFSEQLTASGSGGVRGAISYWDNSHIITEGVGSFGISARYTTNIVNLREGSSVTTFGDNANGIFSIGRANIYLNDSQVITHGAGSQGAMVQYAGNVSLVGSTIRTKGANANGIYMLNGIAESDNAKFVPTVNVQGSSIIAEQGYGIAAQGGTLDIKVRDGSLIKGSAGLMHVYDYTGTNLPRWEQGTTTVNLIVSGGSTVIGKVVTAHSAVTNMTLSGNSLWQFNGDSVLTNLTNDHSTIQFSSNSRDLLSTHTLTVNGDYVGNNGLIIMNGQLIGDNSLIDKVIINGGTSGNTYIQINNLGGLGAKTINGFEVIKVSGDSAGNFEQNGRIVAGAYDYFLVRGTDVGGENNWYLTSTLSGVTQYTLRPETGSYLANLSAANNMFNLRLHDRQGGTSYIDFATGERRTTSMWLRYQYVNNKFGAGNQFDVKNNWYVTQLGGDIAVWSLNEKDRLHLGLMGGYGRSTNSVDTSLSGNRSSGKIDGYSVGLYGTWYENDVTKTGTYIDSWVMWNDLNAYVDGQEQKTEKYDLKGVNLSLESGYTFLAAATTHYNLWLQPQGQMIWMGIDADNHTDSNGTKVTGDGDNLQTRLGLRTVLDSNRTNPDFGGQIFLETNWLYNSKPFSIKMDSDRVYQSGTRNIAELKTGIESVLYKDANIWVNLGYQKGDHRYRNLGLTCGAQYRF